MDLYAFAVCPAALLSVDRRPHLSTGLCSNSRSIRQQRRTSQRRYFEARADASENGNAKSEAKSPPSSLEVMRKFSEQYVKRTDTRFCTDLSVTAVVIRGLAEHKDQLGAPLCPCRHYDDKAAEAAQGFWNCPCVPMRERKECHCMLFLTPDNDFAGEAQELSMDELVQLAP
mmetsp:Transcript_25009/g.41190  ORF Transcript_25009/g.41190 Transcript_25009/m.41190 type:complete len:172 (+) Transcript_25009:46-561(+)